jgi:hypothetical protein
MLKKLILAAAGLALAAPVFAHDGGHGWGHARNPHFHPRAVVVHPRPVVVMPPPRVFYAPPPVVYRPAPVYAAPVPVLPPSGISIRLNFPL